MTISVGDTMPDATLLRIGENGPEEVALSSFTDGQKVVLFGLPGAFTSTCTSAHVPSFIRTADQFREKGVSAIICFSVNDPFVMKEWAKSTGADKAGLEFLADADASLTKALGLAFTVPISGFYDRTLRHSMYVEDGVVKVFNREVARGVCEMTAGETLLDQI